MGVKLFFDNTALNDDSTILGRAGLHNRSVVMVAWQCCRLVASSSSDSTAKIWNAETGKCLFSLIGHRGDVNCIMLDSCERRAVTSGDDCTARVWSLKTGECIATLKGHTNIVWFSSFSPSGDTILTASRDGTAKIWSVQAASCVVTFAGHTSSVRCAAFSHDGAFAATAGLDGTAKVWIPHTCAEVQTLCIGNEVRSIAFLLRTESVATASTSGVVQIWCYRTSDCIATLEGSFVAASPTNNSFLTIREDVAMLWNFDLLTSGACERIIKGHADTLNSASFSADGCFLTIVGGWHGAVWSLDAAECVSTLSGHKGEVLWAG